jgi:hypothetical protein
MRLRDVSLVASLLFAAGSLSCSDSDDGEPFIHHEPDGAAEPDDDAGGPTAPAQCNVPAPTACPDPKPRYADVMPIFERRCVMCHSGMKGGPWPLTSYSHVADWFDIIQAEVQACRMPPPEAEVPITVQERVQILSWIRCGYPR